MLQQTQVNTVIPYWTRWMRELPTVATLAQARPERVLKLWEGLGYYTRARNLHRAAQVIVSERAGEFPQSFDEVLALPGVGRYTAGAICSIAFNQPTPALDGNVIRVLTRAFGIRRNPKKAAVCAQLWKLAAHLVGTAHDLEIRTARRAVPAVVPAGLLSGAVSRQRLSQESMARRAELHHAPVFLGIMKMGARVARPSEGFWGRLREGADIPQALGQGRASTNTSRPLHFRDPSAIGFSSALNQALMELGAVLCTPRQPQCPACPLRKICLARSQSIQDLLPAAGPPSRSVHREMRALVLEHRARFLVRQRPEGMVNAGLWEFPAVEVTEGNMAEILAKLGKQLGVAPFALRRLMRITHSITRYRIDLEVLHGEVRRIKASDAGQGRWLSLGQLAALPFTAAHRRILTRLQPLAGSPK